MRKIITSNKGFSLIELMVVVAIIGVLSAIGVPQYARFQAKARQSEAKTNLSSMFTAQQSFFSEWNCYTSDLNLIGYGAQGTNLRYVTGFDATLATHPVGCATGVPGHHGAGFSVSDAVGSAPTLALVSPGATWLTGLGSVALRTAVAANDVAPTTALFTAVSSGDPKSTIGITVTNPADTWTISQAKNIVNVVSGL